MTTIVVLTSMALKSNWMRSLILALPDPLPLWPLAGPGSSPAGVSRTARATPTSCSLHPISGTATAAHLRAGGTASNRPMRVRTGQDVQRFQCDAGGRDGRKRVRLAAMHHGSAGQGRRERLAGPGKATGESMAGM
jgi:hypothetical protein